jgi:hypothetical protein
VANICVVIAAVFSAIQGGVLEMSRQVEILPIDALNDAALKGSLVSSSQTKFRRISTNCVC